MKYIGLIITAMKISIGGLSFSTAVILAFMSTICKVNNLKLEKKEIIDLAEKVEIDFIGKMEI